MKKYKNNKACGDDLVNNEYIKSTTEKFIELYEKLLNLIFQSGVIPDSCSLRRLASLGFI
jgi:hypothetical protein